MILFTVTSTLGVTCCSKEDQVDYLHRASLYEMLLMVYPSWFSKGERMRSDHGRRRHVSSMKTMSVLDILALWLIEQGLFLSFQKIFGNQVGKTVVANLTVTNKNPRYEKKVLFQKRADYQEVALR